MHSCKRSNCETPHEAKPSTQYTDETIPITCGECDFVSVGLNDMAAHIFNSHCDYTPKEAFDYAVIWMEGAYADAA